MHKIAQLLFAAIVAIVASLGSIAHAIDFPGIYVPASGAWFLRYANSSGPAHNVFTFGPGGGGLVPLKGDWDGSGEDTPGLYVPSTGVFFLRNANSAGAADLAFTFGGGGGGFVPLSGDWDGDGIDTIGLYVPATGAFFLKNTNASGAADIVFTFGGGGLGLIPIMGDWNGDGIDTVGLYNPATGTFFLRNSNSNGAANIAFSFGGPGATPLAGDWNGDGADTIGIYIPSTGVFFLRNSNASGPADVTFSYGPPNVVPRTGRWNANGGDLVNGALHTGTLGLPQEVDIWTFTATAGDRIAVHVGEITDNNDFRPWIQLEGPSGFLASSSGTDAAAIDGVAAPETGTYRVHVASFDSGLDGTGTYRLTMTKTPGPITVSFGDQGGPLTNGALHTGEILQGDLDVWTFTATAGDRIGLHVGEVTDNDDFRPWIRLWAPNGAILGSTSGVGAAVIDGVAAPVTGTYLVLVASFDSGLDGTGTYQLTMTKTPGPITVTAGDQGGPLTNGALHTGEIVRGDLDVWTFTANAGERIGLHIGEITDTDDFRPWIRLWAPNGAILGSTSGTDAAVIDGVSAPVTGTYLVLVGSFDSGVDGTGTYQLTMAKTPGPITVSAGDQGGPLTNGVMHTGEIVQGDLDVWTFTATAGERIGLHIGEITDIDDFRPWIRLWAPNGAILGSTSGTDAAVIDGVAAPVTGTYLVLVGSFDSGVDGTGTYRLTMTKTPGPITVSGGDQGGPLTNGGMHTGEIVQGDLDVWTFTATAGERIGLHIGEITDTDDFRPWIRLWAPNGAILGSTSGTDAAVIDGVAAPVTGTYLVLVGSFDSGVDGTGTYRLTMTKTPGPITVSAGDQGGALTSGVAQAGEIVQGDVDVWTINAVAGQQITALISETSEIDDFRPWIRVWAPNGTILGSVSGLTNAQVGPVVAPVTGTYLVLVGSFDSGVDGTGTYSLTVSLGP